MPEEITGQVVATPTEEDQPTAAVSTETESAALPDEASERTKEQFAKLTEHNKQMAEELKTLKATQQQKSVLEAYLPSIDDTDLQPIQGIAPPNLTQGQVNQIKNSLIDENGYVDGAALERELQKASMAERHAREANDRAARLEQQLQRMNIDQQTKELYKEFPELNPTSKEFSEDAYNLVKKELLSDMVTTGKQDALGAAHRMAKYFRKDAKQAEKQEKLQQATVTVGSGSNSARRKLSSEEFDKLKEKSRHDQTAMAERLQRSGY